MTTTQVLVAPEVVVYAIRYGLGRLTYAHSDALELVKAHWPLIVERGWARTTRNDVEAVVQTTTDAHTRNTAREVLEWIDAQPTPEGATA